MDGLMTRRTRPRMSVVVPTVSEREEHLDRCIEAYERSAPADFELIVIRDEPGCGSAWVKGVAESRGDFIHLSADDLEPHPGWWQHAFMAVLRDVYPAACVYRPDGYLESAGLCDDRLLAEPIERLQVPAAGVPFLPRLWWEEHVDQEALAGLHYSTDLLLSHWMRAAGKTVEVRVGFAFTHHWAMAGRQSMEKLNADFARYREIVAGVAA